MLVCGGEQEIQVPVPYVLVCCALHIIRTVVNIPLGCFMPYTGLGMKFLLASCTTASKRRIWRGAWLVFRPWTTGTAPHLGYCILVYFSVF